MRMTEYQILFIEYVNNYLTVTRFAHDHGYTINEANNIINIGRAYNNNDMNGLQLLLNNN